MTSGWKSRRTVLAAPWPICSAAARNSARRKSEDGLAVITGKAPVAEMRGCAREVTAYTPAVRAA